MEIETLNDYCQIVTSIAKGAVAEALKDFSSSREVKLDLERDIKISADREIESYIVSELRKYFEYPILAEESGLSEQPLSIDNSVGYKWIVDPLDGSLNFSRGIPICCVSIALWQETNPLLGIIYDFTHDELFTGIVGSGAWLNSKAITVSKVSQKSKAVICSGFPVSTNFTDLALREFVNNVQIYKKVRMIGSAALSLAYVASGRVDCYIENDIKIWDVAAGLALVSAAGGSANCVPSKNKNILRVEASNGLIDIK
jgi:myo-inositol-1(or 4)-monophosphatase